MIFSANLPALQVLIPLIAAPICSLLSGRRIIWIFVALITFITFACSIAILSQVYTNGTISYPMGGWLAPFGIEYKIDSLSAMFLLLISGIASVTIIYAWDSVEKEISAAQQPFFYTAYLLCFAGMLGIVATNDIFNIYVFLEISSLATYALVAMGKDKRALIAAFEYLILGTIGATFILIAIGFVYAMTGSLNISDIAMRIKPVLGTMPVKMAIAFFTVGLALKIAIFPLHLWLANAYTNAPSFVSSFLAATTTKVGIYVLIRITYNMFGREFAYTSLPIGQILIILGLLGILVASVVAIMQDNIKKMLAYSSVAQVGYIILGIGLANIQGISASLLQIVFFSIAKAAMFMAAGAVLFSVKGVRLENFAGIGRRMPFTMTAFIISGLSMAGIPGTAGFVAKWYLLQATISAGMWHVFVVVIISSLLTLVYIWKVVEVAFFDRVDGSKGGINEAPLLMLVPMLGLALLSIVLGIYPGCITGYVAQVVTGLFGG